MAESTPQPPEHDIEAAPQQPIQDENPPADGDKHPTSDNYGELIYQERLYNYIKPTGDFGSTLYLDFHDLAQMNILRLMGELAKYDQAGRKDKLALGDHEHIGDLLHRYSKCVYLAMMLAFPLTHRMSATALQDLEYWSRLPKYYNWCGMQVYNELRQMFPAVYGDQGNLNFAYLDGLPKSPSSSTDPLRSFLKKVREWVISHA